MSPAAPLALTLIGLSLPALAASGLDGAWDCKAGREIVGRLLIEGARYTLGDGTGSFGARTDGVSNDLVDGPLVDDWHLSRLLLETVDGAELLRLQVSAMYAPRSIGSCTRATEPTS